MASESIEPFKQGGHECDRQAGDRQTDHSTEKCVGIGGGIACAARAILSNNALNSSQRGWYSIYLSRRDGWLS